MILDTLIVWTEIRNNIDMALSFQEGDGCAAIWLVYKQPASANTHSCTGNLSTTFSSNLERSEGLVNFLFTLNCKNANYRCR